MTVEAEMRLRRIERLMAELEYEITRGVMEREIEPDIHLSKNIPLHGVDGFHMAALEIHVHPDMYGAPGIRVKPKLRIVE